MQVYYDANATTPIDPRVLEIVVKYLRDEFGNAGSRTHAYGSRAAKAVEEAREHVAEVIGLRSGRVVFTSGATESNNLALLGLGRHGRETGRMRIVTSQIEHKAVLEPLERLEAQGFDVVRVPPDRSGIVPATRLLEEVDDTTLLVSLMHVNNETGMRQPVREVAEALASSATIMHVDAAQGFGKDIDTLLNAPVDLLSVSGHKLYAPKGVGACILNYASGKKLEIEPIMVGGGQEGGLRPGTLPVHLIAGLGEAARIAKCEHDSRNSRNKRHLAAIAKAAEEAGGIINGDLCQSVGNVINVSFPGVDSESAMLLLQDDVAISNGSACTSASYTHSHVLVAMGLPPEGVESALRVSWYHETPEVDWRALFSRIENLR